MEEVTVKTSEKTVRDGGSDSAAQGEAKGHRDPKEIRNLEGKE